MFMSIKLQKKKQVTLVFVEYYSIPFAYYICIHAYRKVQLSG